MDKVGAKKIYAVLEKIYPSVTTSLTYKGPLELLVATILSAQCTDVRVNIVTKELFRKYRGAKDYAGVEISFLEEDIRSTGFYRNKAKNIKATCGMIVSKYKGKVPDTMEELIKLPGVARKTANIVLFHGYGKCEGIAVDTHVKRLSGRIGLSEQKDPEKIEKDLMAIFDKDKWGTVSNLLIEHGRAVCSARKSACVECRLGKICGKINV